MDQKFGIHLIEKLKLLTLYGAMVMGAVSRAIHYALTTTAVHARRNPQNVMSFDMLDYDARKYFTYL